MNAKNSHRLKDVLTFVGKSFSHFFYPSLCLHCKLATSNKLPLCQSCTSLLEFLAPHSRCLSCFQKRDEHFCEECRALYKRYRTAAAFSYEGPVKDLLHEFKFNKMVGLSALLGSFMAVQWLSLLWEKPDYIIPIPQSWLKSWQRGFHPTFLLSQELSKQLNVPVIKKLGRTVDAPSQSQLSKQLRQQFDPTTLILKKSPVVTNKRILLIDDVVTTGQTVFHAAALLEEEGPYSIDVLSLTLTE